MLPRCAFTSNLNAGILGCQRYQWFDNMDVKSETWGRNLLSGRDEKGEQVCGQAMVLISTYDADADHEDDGDTVRSRTKKNPFATLAQRLNGSSELSMLLQGQRYGTVDKYNGGENKDRSYFLLEVQRTPAAFETERIQTEELRANEACGTACRSSGRESTSGSVRVRGWALVVGGDALPAAVPLLDMAIASTFKAFSPKSDTAFAGVMSQWLEELVPGEKAASDDHQNSIVAILGSNPDSAVPRRKNADSIFDIAQRAERYGGQLSSEIAELELGQLSSEFPIQLELLLKFRDSCRRNDRQSVQAVEESETRTTPAVKENSSDEFSPFSAMAFGMKPPELPCVCDECLGCRDPLLYRGEWREDQSMVSPVELSDRGVSMGSTADRGVSPGEVKSMGSIADRGVSSMDRHSSVDRRSSVGSSVARRGSSVDSLEDLEGLFPNLMLGGNANDDLPGVLDGQQDIKVHRTKEIPEDQRRTTHDLLDQEKRAMEGGA